MVCFIPQDQANVWVEDNMNSWIKADHDFGVPWVRLVVSMRDMIAGRLLGTMKDIALPQDIALYLEQEIPKLRPDLKGCQVFGINCGRVFGVLNIDVGHPSLQRVQMSHMPEEQWLEPCAVCKKPMLVDGNMWCRNTPDGYEKVCSEECSIKSAQDQWNKEVKPDDDSSFTLKKLPPLKTLTRIMDQLLPTNKQAIIKDAMAKAADSLMKATAACEVELVTNGKVAQSMIARGQAFRCSKCGKLRLMGDCATKDSPELKCKTCINHRLEHEEMDYPGDAVI
jgi:hypothetical protein